MPVPPRAVMLDTNVVSYLMRKGELGAVYRRALANTAPVISFITVGEMLHGARRRAWGPRRMVVLRETLGGFPVVVYDREVAEHYAWVLHARERIGRPVSTNDAWIAACALRHGIPLVTHNGRDFEGIEGLEVISKGA